MKSENIERYLEILEEQRLATHNIIMAKGENIFFEKYWSPFYTIGFRDDVCGIYMNKIAEDFLREYEGFAGGKKE